LIYKDEAPYLAEWIEFHRLVGVERFFLYDNGSRDDHLEVLGPYLEEGTVVLHDQSVFFRQAGAYAHCLTEHGSHARWIAFIDTDEFLFAPTGRPLPEVLAAFEQFPGVGVYRVTFGTSGHRTRPDGLVTETYVLKFRVESSVKSIVDPSRVERQRNAHSFLYHGGALAVDENREPIEGWFLEEPTSELLRINHYVTKSEAEFAQKLTKGRVDNDQPWEPRDDIPKQIGEIKDETIGVYLPSLREALARRGR